MEYRKHSKEHNRKISNSIKEWHRITNYIYVPKNCNKCGDFLKKSGEHKCSKKINAGNFKIGQVGYWKGKKRPKETCEKISVGRIGKYGGINHPNFNNWSSREPYGVGFNNKFKEYIRKKFNYRCQECFRHQDELFYKNGKKYSLIVHHINYNKRNNDENNLIPLCHSCHTQTNYGRDDWINYFQNRLNGAW